MESSRKAGGEEMGLPVQMLARDVGCGALELPLDDDLRGSETAEAEAARIDILERDRRFAEMAERNARLMFRVAHSLLRSVQDAEDAVQEALLKLYRGNAWLRMEDERAFLARTVWRAGLDVAARRSKRTEPLEDDAGREFAATGGTAEQSLVEHGERAALRRLIEALPEDLRQPLVLSAIEEMTSREVAIALGIPEGTVRTRVMRARTELKRRFEAMRVSNLHRNGDAR
jgi:RNA polymerase sigma-70 factor (ECF subfamily)